MTLGVRAVILDEKKNSVFLVKHTYVPGWQLPGGGVERGETFGQALEKELREEANIVLKGPAKLLRFTRMRMHRRVIMWRFISAGSLSRPGRVCLIWKSQAADFSRWTICRKGRQHPPSGACRKCFMIWSRFHFGEGALRLHRIGACQKR